ncbi:transglutaminaseTgpA domain-containing protein [Microbacterium flavescens]|uniref:transglutaminaseTgpA domain-containing protein n=1 Tax=Microbacterium flavescens TaxID=69366 RepID=UPI0027DBF217|nr:transglutaminaseTgpA domain-containing protein [Microbacterium flavescens]
MTAGSAQSARTALPMRRWVLDLSAVAALLAVPIAGFWPTFAAPSYLPAAVGGALLGMGLAALCAWLRWGVLPLAGLTVVAYFLFGGALALPHTAAVGVIPTIDTLGRLALGVVTSWKQLLTTVAPVAASDGHLIVPFLLALVAAVITTSLALRLRTPAWALIPAAAFLVAQIALGTSQPAVPVVQGVVFALVAAVWLAVRQSWEHGTGAVPLGDDATPVRGVAARRLLLGGAVVAVAALVGVGASAFAAPQSPRYVLRDVVIPPFDVRAYPSPLQSFRAYVRDFPDEPLFSVTGMPEEARVRLATVDAYDGTVYNVSDEGAGTSSAFSPVRGNMSAQAEGTPATVHVEIDALEGVWMPEVGAVRSIAFDGDRAEDLRRSAYYNEGTETAVVTRELGEGDAYTLESVVPSTPSDEALEGDDFAPVSLPDQEGVPQDIAEIASEAVAEATTPVEQVRALQTMLAEGGFFSHGLEGEVLSRAGHGAERISTLLGSDQMVGDDEQYATAMALMAREIGIPARVVMGFYPEEDAADEPVFTATGDTLHAWVEVAFAEHGWVTFDPTPPEDQVPNDQTTKPRADPKPQVLQPPPPPQEPVDLPPTVPDDRESEDESAFDGALLALIAVIVVGVLGVLALLAAPFIVIGALKAARRRRRKEAERAADRISGGWDEIVDHAKDYGTPVAPGATRAEDAGVVEEAFAEPRVTTLAARADLEVFGPTEPTADDVAEFWRQVDEIVGGMGAGRSVWNRLGARLSLRSLLAGTRFALPARAPRAPRPPREGREKSSRRAPEPAAPQENE